MTVRPWRPAACCGMSFTTHSEHGEYVGSPGAAELRCLRRHCRLNHLICPRLQAEAQHALERAAASLGGADSVHCSLSLEPAAVAQPNAAASAAAPRRLVISRYVAGRPPLLVAVPLRQLAVAADEQQVRPPSNFVHKPFDTLYTFC